MWLLLMVIKAIIDPKKNVKHEEENIKSVVRSVLAQYKLEKLTESIKNDLTSQINEIVQKRLKTFDKSFLNHCQSWFENPLNAEALISEYIYASDHDCPEKPISEALA